MISAGDTSLAMDRPCILVCEDGTEYLERFERFLAADFRFVATQHFAGLRQALDREVGARALLLDLDFQRTELRCLVDAHGDPLALAPADQRRELTRNQGIAILGKLRRERCLIPAFLFGDFQDPQQCSYLRREFAPLELVPSHAGLAWLRLRLNEVCGERY